MCQTKDEILRTLDEAIEALVGGDPLDRLRILDRVTRAQQLIRESLPILWENPPPVPDSTFTVGPGNAIEVCFAPIELLSPFAKVGPPRIPGK